MKIIDIDFEINKEKFKFVKENVSKIIEDGFIQIVIEKGIRN